MAGKNAGYGITDPGSSAITTFTELTDTPESITADQYVLGNSEGNALIFGQLPTNMGTFTGLTDTPDSYGTSGQLVTVNMEEDGLEFSDPAATSFLRLTDTPGSFTPNRHLKTNADGNAIELDDLGLFRFTGTVKISASVDITSANLSDYQNKIWLITSNGQIDVTIADNLELTFFGLYVVGNSNGVLLSASSESAAVRIDNEINKRYGRDEGLIFIRTSANEYHSISNDAAASRFTDLRDTPSTITANQYIRGNSSGGGLVFGALPDDVITIQDSGTEESTSVHTLNFNTNLDVSVSSGVATVNGSSTTGSSTFLSLTDTPSDFTAFQVVRVNSQGNGLEFSPFPAAIFTVQNGGTVVSNTISTLNFTDNITATVGVSGSVNISATSSDTNSTNWDHATLPSGRIPANNRRWYTYTSTGNASRQLPLESGISSGWHAFFGNDSTTATLTLNGDFRGSLTSISLLPQQGCEISYNGSLFLEGPARNLITVSSFPDWQGNPLRPSTFYSGFSTNANGLNLNNDATRTALLNRNVRIVPTSGPDFHFDLEPLDSSNFSDIPIGSGFGVIHQGVEEVLIRPANNNTLTRSGITHNFSNVVRLSPGASITFVRSGQDTWNTTIQSGTITGGT